MNKLKLLQICIQARIPVYMWGPPGIGKTAVVSSLADALEYGFVTETASRMAPEEVTGIPHIKDGEVVTAAPEFFNLVNGEKDCVLFLDEFNCASPRTLAPWLRAIQENRVGQRMLPGVAWVAASNPPDQAVGGYELDPPMANRFCHIDWELTPADWFSGMTTGWAKPTPCLLPKYWEKNLPFARGVVVSFHKACPGLLLKVPTNGDMAWPSPRSWDMVATAYAACLSIDEGKSSIFYGMVTGLVGKGPANSFFEYVVRLDLPNPDDILDGKITVTVPKRDDKSAAIIQGIVCAFIANHTQTRWQTLWEVFQTFQESGKADLLVVPLGELIAALNLVGGYRLPSNLSLGILAIIKERGKWI